MKKHKLLYIFLSLLVLHSCNNTPSLQDPNLVGGAIVYSIVLVIGIYAIIMFKTLLFLVFYSFRAYYSPADYKRKESYLKKQFDHLKIDKKLNNITLKSVKFKSFKNFQYHNFLIKNQKKKTILSVDIDIPIAKFWARWIERRINNIWNLEPERSDAKEVKNLIWKVSINISYEKNNNKKEERHLTLFEISDEDLTTEIYEPNVKKSLKRNTLKNKSTNLINNEIKQLKKINKKDQINETDHSIYMPKSKDIKQNKDKNKSMSKEEALNKLKEKKELLDLEIITQEEYDKVKDELKSIITKKD